MGASFHRDSNRMPRQARCIWLAIAGFVACVPVCALERDRTIAQFYHTAWTVREGAPDQISALAQTTDGYIWLSAVAALYRFDGVRFKRFEDITSDVSALKALDDGSLWIGYEFGGASLLKDGQLTNYGDREGMPEGTVFGFAADRQHAVWAATVKGLMRFDGSSWQSIGSEWNYPDGKSRAVFVDHEGTLWAATGETVMSLAPGARRFEDTGRRASWVVQMAQAPDGTVWTADAFGTVQATVSASGGAPANAGVIRVESGGLLFDRDGALWVGSLGDGLRRVAYPERAVPDRGGGEIASEAFKRIEGLSADYVWPLLEDREGNIWVGTSGGLDEFRNSAIAPALFPPGSHDLALVAGDDGAVWAGTTNRTLMRLRNNIVTATDGAMRTTCAYRADDGTIWLGGQQGIWRIVGDKPTLVTALPEGVGSVDVQSMVMDRRGVLWVGITNAGLFRLADGTWSQVDDPAFTIGSRKLKTPLVATSDAQGRILLGYGRGGLVMIDGDATKVFAAGDGLDLGNVAAIKQGSRTIWVGGERGLASFDGSRFQTLGVEGEPLSGIVGIIETADGSLWLHAVSGVLHFSAAEVAHALADPTYRMRYRLFDVLDGLSSGPTQLRPLPTAIESSDGRLWFATLNGAAWIDPKSITTNALPPPVVIESIGVGDKRLPILSPLKLPERTKQVEVDYTALSYSVPQRVRFRYRLDGVDADWQDVGARRQAIYTNLGPGDYRFRVVAANEDGIWNEAGAALDFAIAPAYYQTWWFRALCVVLAAVVISLLLYLRVRAVLARMRARLEERLEERHNERARIARDLHDTLLQSIQALMIRFQIAAVEMPAGSAARNAITQALDLADQVLVEGRDRVSDLRSSIDSAEDLAQAFTTIGEQMATEHDVEFRVIVEGQKRVLDANFSDEIFCIGREALVNAFQHAHAASIEIEIAFETDTLRVRVRDDGVGIDAGILEAGRRPGHWGLPGMRERALKIGARLDIWGGTGSGTEVELRVPASVAYLAESGRSWRQLVRRIVGAGR